ncbi:hypothetical protein LSCM1_05501 [Leishmania martiniquensis]|uniref:adenylate cyclase n=1 Tax=Leishmania martiniquensis TaxID=1580590 RepID=A0A836GWL8_9TRYP|nr:hypothetical protein LSCM1_05501 [Leishmania martiniquensis]
MRANKSHRRCTRGCGERGGAGGVDQPPAYRRPRLLAAALLIAGVLALVVPTTRPVRAAGAANDEKGPVLLLNTMYSASGNVEDHAKALWLGVDSALYSAKYTTAGGRTVKIVEPDPNANRADIVAVVKKALADNEGLLGVIGPYSDSYLATALRDSDIRESGLMFLSPFTGSGAVRVWDDSVYFTRAEPRLEIMAIVQHIANTIRSRRSAFMYLTGVQYGDREYKDIVELMPPLSLDPPAVYAVPYSRTDVAVDKKAFDAMADTRPQVVILWSLPGQQVVNFLEAVLTDPRTSSAYIMTSFHLQQTVFNVYYGLAMEGKLTPVDGQIISSGTSFPLTEPDSLHIPIFKEQMGKYIEAGKVDEQLWAAEAAAVRRYGPHGLGSPLSAPPTKADTFFHEHPNAAQLMLTGWLAGSLIMQTLSEEGWIDSVAAYRHYLFQQRRYIIGGDYVIGDYGGSCNEMAKFLGAACSCNQGGRGAALASLSKAAWTSVDDSGVSYSQNVCYSDTLLPPPANLLAVILEEYPHLAQVGRDLATAVSAIVHYVNFREKRVNVASLPVTHETAEEVYDKIMNDYTADIVAGVILSGLHIHRYLVLSPLYPQPRLVEPVRNYVYLMPTLEQQMFVLYANLEAVRGVTSLGSHVHVILHNYEGEEVATITGVLYRSAATFNYDDPSVSVVPSTKTVGSALARRRINLVLAVTAADVTDIVNFLLADATAIVVIVFDDLMLQYTTLVDKLSVALASVQARVITFTNLPLWSDKSATAHAASPLLQLFHAALKETTQYTPTMLRHFVTVLVAVRVIEGKERLGLDTLTDTIYLNGAVSTYGMSFGEFDWGCTTIEAETLCVYQNYGAQNIAMLSMQRILDPKVPQLTRPMTPSMEYRPRERLGALTPMQRNAIIIGSVVGGVALIAGCTLLLYCCIDSRDNDAAPRDSDGPVTLIFTDIESSTALWAALPQLMTDAIAAHHRVIRQLIKKYRCYEVKTIGDSFMIACKDAHTAVGLACEIQTRLLAHDWGTECFDGAYREFELGRVDTVGGYEPPTARLSEEEYAALWRGLRVRVGIHTGLSDIRYDEVTKGYDYYGDTSNMAARTEAVANGGQVIATETTWWALSDEERGSTAHTAMGPQGLRGVPFAVEMYQVNAVPGRRHAALRTELEAILPDETATETASSGAGALLSSVGTMTGPAAGIALVLSNCFAPYPVGQRVRELQPLLSKWGVGAPPRSRLVSEEDYCQGLMNRLAIRIATVWQARQRMDNSGASALAALQGLGAGGVVNPFAGEGGSVSDGARRRHSVVTASQRSVEPSAMRRLRALHSSPLSDVQSLVLMPRNERGCEARTALGAMW